jgi:Outer membrane lipoprotein-sorting protein
MKWIACLAIAACIAVGEAAAAPSGERSAPPALTVEAIVARNLEARGGLEAWRKIDTMVWTGHIDTDKSPGGLQFLLEMKRPNKTRFEIKGPNQQMVRAFDGKDGWKLHPAKAGGPEVQSFDADELKYAQDAEGFDGLLIDADAKGITIALEGAEQVEGHKAYRLRITKRSGVTRHAWVDAKSFLDVKYDRVMRDKAGQYNTVTVYYRDYQKIEGVKLPMTIETSTGSAKNPDRMVIERVALNPPLADRIFARPHMPQSRTKMVTIGESPQAPLPRNPLAAPMSPAAPPGPVPQAELAPGTPAPH